MIGRWDILNTVRERRYADGRREPNGAEVPLWERWKVRAAPWRSESPDALEAEQVAVADAREGPWRQEKLGPFPMIRQGMAFAMANADASLIITGISDGAALSGRAVTLRADHAKIEEWVGVCDGH